MNAQYTSNPKEIQNEPNLFGFVCVIPAQAGIQKFSCRQKNKKSKSCLSCKPRQKFKNDKTNPISKSLTHYKEMTNPKIAKQKRTQTNPILTKA
jgi:hypothetical protein